MKKHILFFLAMAMSVAMMAVPARRGFHDYPLSNGGSIQLTLAGDEFAHWFEAADGTVYYQQPNGTFAPAGTNSTTVFNRRKLSPKFKSVQSRRARMNVGVTPNLAPKGVVILVNFNDTKMKSSHTLSTFNELFNSENCTVNSGYPSAGEYFKSQSNGAYHPQFDVFGPVTLSKGYAYYGENTQLYDETTGEYYDGDDKYATDAVIEACILANQQYADLDFANYDSDNDGYIDFVYVVYAGKGEADGGAASTIWPHNWEAMYNVYPYNDDGEYDPVNGTRMSCCYTENDIVFDNKTLNNYAMSSELEGSGTFGGIGTLCHEFGHVMGLPDLYDIEYGNISQSGVTPNDWNIMDGGSYNADGHCPPNYDPWQKYFFGWVTPINLGSEGANLTLQANGTQGYQTYQINASGTLQGPTTSGLCYYIENRQAQGWDTPLTGHGMLIWKVNFNKKAWEANGPNSSETSGAPLHTIVSAYGTKIGYTYRYNNYGEIIEGSGTDNCPMNPFPGTKKITSWSGVNGKPLKNIAEANGVITLTYIEEPAADPFDITWMVGSTEFAKTTSTGKVVLPDDEPEACADGKVFVGWCKTADYSSATTAPTFVKAGDAAAEGDIFYAVFATKDGEGGAPQTTTYTFTSKAWADATGAWTSTKDGNQLTSGQGVQVTSAASGAGAETKQALDNVSKVVVNYCTNASKGAGSITVSIGSTKQSEDVTKNGGTTLRALEYTFSNASGKAAFEVTCSTNSIYVNSVSITAGGGASYSAYTTSCAGQGTAVDNTAVCRRAVKAIRNGQVVILRDGEVFNILGVRQ